MTVLMMEGGYSVGCNDGSGGVIWCVSCPSGTLADARGCRGCDPIVQNCGGGDIAWAQDESLNVDHPDQPSNIISLDLTNSYLLIGCFALVILLSVNIGCCIMNHWWSLQNKKHLYIAANAKSDDEDSV